MPIRILITDDEPIILGIVKEFLQSENCEVIACQDGGEAIMRIQKFNPDLVLMDLMMDGVDGLFALKEIKSNESTSHIPVIVVTAIDVSGATGQECLDSGAFAVIEKPIDFNKLRKIVFQAVPLHDGAEEDEDEDEETDPDTRLNVLASLGLSEESLSELFAQDEI